MTTNRKERERVQEAMSKSFTAKPSRQREIAEIVEGRLGTEDQRLEQSGKKKDLCGKVAKSSYAGAENAQLEKKRGRSEHRQ